jgi:hypothetical protein
MEKGGLFSTDVAALFRREVDWLRLTQNPVITGNCNNGGVAFHRPGVARDTTIAERLRSSPVVFY